MNGSLAVLVDAVDGLEFRSILRAWGMWCRQGLDHLGYSKVHYLINSHSKASFLNEDELAKVDAVMANVKPENVKMLKARYIQELSYRDLCKALHFGSTATVGKRLEGAEKDFSLAMIYALSDALPFDSKAKLYAAVVTDWEKMP